MSEARITSRHNARVKEAARLRSRRHRQRQGRFLIDGGREISRAVRSGIHCELAFICEELADSLAAREALAALREQGAELFSVTLEVYEKLCYGERQEGIVVVADTPRRQLCSLSLSASPLIAVVEGIEKPGNLGAILRSADAAGVEALIAADPRTDLYNPNTIRASLGTVFRPGICAASAAASASWLRAHNVKIITADPAARALYWVADFRGPTAIVFGSEAEGLSEIWKSEDTQAIRLPMRGIADSLNVSASAAVLFYEALRQRQDASKS